MHFGTLKQVNVYFVNRNLFDIISDPD